MVTHQRFGEKNLTSPSKNRKMVDQVILGAEGTLLAGCQLTGLPMSLSCLSDISLLSHSSSAFSLSMNNCRKAQRQQVNSRRED